MRFSSSALRRRAILGTDFVRLLRWILPWSFRAAASNIHPFLNEPVAPPCQLAAMPPSSIFLHEF
jgi:hypothetical protein